MFAMFHLRRTPSQNRQAQDNLGGKSVSLPSKAHFGHNLFSQLEATQQARLASISPAIAPGAINELTQPLQSVCKIFDHVFECTSL